METVLNIVIIALVLLITYWWANQGFFSSILHLLCTIVAGAIALAFWELVTTKFLLRGSNFDDYAWGVSLIGLFVLTLAVLRVATNKLAPNNVQLPHWANLVGGGVLGAASGVITMGILLIGLGFLQADNTTVGFKGWARGSRGQIQQVATLWVPVHEWTSNFYEMMSVGSFRSSAPLRQYYPGLWKQSTLIHDAYTRSGRLVGKVSMTPRAVRVDRFALTQQNGKSYYAVSLHFTSEAFDFGTMLTISSAQMQLVGGARGTAAPAVAFPEFWEQRTATGSGTYGFDDLSHYITSVPAQDSADAVVYFPAQQLGTELPPRMLLIKGTRVMLPGLEQGASITIASGGGTKTVDPSAPKLGDPVIRVSNDIRPVDVGLNAISGTIHVLTVDSKNYLTDGEQDFEKGGARAGGKLRVNGIHEPEGEVCLQVDVSRDTGANIQPFRERDENAGPLLVDDHGNSYPPIGYIHERSEKVMIKLSPGNRIVSLKQLPALPSSNSERLRLVFRVTSGVHIVGFMVGDATVGTCDITPVQK